MGSTSPEVGLGPQRSPSPVNEAAAAGATPQQILVEIDLVRNPKAIGARPFVARLRQDGSLEFLRAAVPVFVKGVLVGGKYRLNIGELIITREDRSSHKNERINYVLYRVAEDGLKTIAWVSIHNGTPEFSSEELEQVYAYTENGAGSRAIAALISYARAKGLLG